MTATFMEMEIRILWRDVYASPLKYQQQILLPKAAVMLPNKHF